MIDFELESSNRTVPVAKIKVLGVGGGGCNMVNSMIQSGYSNIDFIAVNTDVQALRISQAPHKIQLGVKSAKGLGAGANPELGRKAAEEDIEKIQQFISDADIVFLTGGLGGGTGSGALPVIARMLKDNDILSVAIVTKPFIFEGKKRMKIAQDAIELLKREVDTLVVIPNQKLLDVVDQKESLMNAFGKINEVLNKFVGSISDIIAKPGHINVDFADIKAIMRQKGNAIIGIGSAYGENRALMAAQDAISSPLLENMSIDGARGVLINITGNSTLGLHEISQATSLIHNAAHEDATIILGSVIDESAQDLVTVTIIATGFTENLIEPAQDIRAANQNYQPKIIEKPQAIEINSFTNSEGINIDINNFDIPAVMRKMAQEKLT